MATAARGLEKNCPKKESRRPDPVPYSKDQLKGLFWRYDKNRDCHLSKKELQEAFKRLGSRIPQYRATKALQYADGNKNGYISEDEMEKLVEYADKLNFKVK